MKKILSITSSLILASSAVTVLATNINTYQATQKTNENGNINWTNVKFDSSNYFKNIKENYYKNPKSSLIKNNQTVDMNKVIKYAQDKANNYINNFQKQNLNLNQIIKTLSKDSPQFAKSYNSGLNKKDSGVKTNLILKNNLGLLKDTSFSSLENYVYNLKIAKTTFISVSATAAIAAAGFWAAAWWFGVSIPWAVGSTTASALAGGIAAGINIALVKYDNELSGIDKAAISFASIYKLGHIFYAVLNPLLIGSSATATSLSWAFPAILSIIPVASAILAWIN